MARWHYPRSRRILMQLAMCVIFAGSIGLAALVTRERRDGGFTRLEGMRYVGDTGIRLPAGWILKLERQGFILFVTKEPSTPNREGRTLIIRRQKVDSSLKPDEYLEKSGLLQGTQPYNSDDQAVYGTEPITLAHAEGIMLAVERPTGFIPFGAQTYEPEWIACGVRHSGVAITLQLFCPNGTQPDDDKQTLREIAGAIEVKD